GAKIDTDRRAAMWGRPPVSVSGSSCMPVASRHPPAAKHRAPTRPRAASAESRGAERGERAQKRTRRGARAGPTVRTQEVGAAGWPCGEGRVKISEVRLIQLTGYLEHQGA